MAKDFDLAVRNLACRTGVLPRYFARRLALFDKLSRLLITRTASSSANVDDIVAHRIGQGMSLRLDAPELSAAAMGQDRQSFRPLRTGSGAAHLEEDPPGTGRHLDATRSCVKRTDPFLHLPQ